ncbi:hypothetical protein SEA_MADAMATO_49 [Streptomyces phage Madamato]|nr:hypothetical protein SEA_MADAMATO_49 [Streptomyces phage Madamato]
MSNTAKNNKTTAESVVAQAAEEKLVTPTVPAQSENASEPKVVTGEVVEETTETPELEVVEGGKKSLKERLESVTEKLKENKKVVAGVVVTVGLAAVAFAKFAAKQAVEAPVDEDEAALEVVTGENQTDVEPTVTEESGEAAA